MKSITGLWAACLFATILLTGCDRIPGVGPDTLVIDLGAIAKATGQDRSMQALMRAAHEELNTQLAESAKNLERQIEQERAGIGDTPTTEQEMQLQQLTLEAQQRYGQLQAEAQQKAQQREVNIVLDFREQVMPFAEKIARSRGVSVVLLVDQTMFWFDPAVDITGEVIDAIRESGVFEDSSADADSTTAP